MSSGVSDPIHIYHYRMCYWIVWSDKVKPELTWDMDKANEVRKQGGFTIQIRAGAVHDARLVVQTRYIPAYESGDLDKTVWEARQSLAKSQAAKTSA